MIISVFIKRITYNVKGSARMSIVLSFIIGSSNRDITLHENPCRLTNIRNYR